MRTVLSSCNDTLCFNACVRTGPRLNMRPSALGLETSADLFRAFLPNHHDNYPQPCTTGSADRSLVRFAQCPATLETWQAPFRRQNAPLKLHHNMPQSGPTDRCPSLASLPPNQVLGR